MIQFDKFLKYTNERLATAGLTLSDYGIEELRKRFNKPEAEGGYSTYWHTL